MADMRCRECSSEDGTKLEMQADRGGKLIRFRVDCDCCGCFSHYLEYGEVNRAVKTWHDKAMNGVALLLTLLRKDSLWPMLDAEEQGTVKDVERFFQGR